LTPCELGRLLPTPPLLPHFPLELGPEAWKA
jgi:hypothetical protein